MQKDKLFYLKEQEKDQREAGNEKALQVLQ
jgi:hypothetical protein